MLIGLVLVAATHAEWIDPAVALAVAFGVAFAGVRILLRSTRSLVDKSLPQDELDWIRSTISPARRSSRPPADSPYSPRR